MLFLSSHVTNLRALNHWYRCGYSSIRTCKMTNNDLQFIQIPNPITGTLEWSVCDKEDHDYFAGETY